MNILDLFQGDGIEPKYKAATKGGEYGAACPFCGGKDRLIIHPNLGDGGRWWCRQCGRSGDAIQYLRDYRKMGFRDACQYMGREVTSFTPSSSGRKAPRTAWKPRATTAPSDLWQGKARRLVEESENWLVQPSTFGQKMLGWLKERRGLSEGTIRAHRLGLVPIDRFEGHEQWGLKPVFKDNGTPKKIWIPRGLTIPFCQDERIYRIRIRRPKFALRSEGDPRYYLLRGSDTRALVLGQDRDVFVIVESELDAILLFQEAGDLVGVIALGNAQARPDKEAMAALVNCKLILVALDGDAAGAKEAWQWWLHLFSQAPRWPPIDGKDPGEMFTAGVNLRDWIAAGIDEYSKGVVLPGGEAIEPPTPSQEDEITVMHVTSPNSSLAEDVAEEKGYSEQITPERDHTCYDCSHFRPAVRSPNPTQAWGYCEQKRKGRFGVARACEGIAE